MYQSVVDESTFKKLNEKHLRNKYMGLILLFFLLIYLYNFIYLFTYFRLC